MSEFLPKDSDLSELIESLLGREPKVTGGALPDSEVAVVASYVDREGSLECLVVTDIALGAYLGAALALVPKGGAQDCVDEGALSSNLKENFHEVLNIMASLFNTTEGSRHVRLSEVHYGPADQASDGARGLSQAPGERADFEVVVENYGTGKLAVLVA
ncbi:MAG: hypothetical protein S0880_12340 [Actinomycetota bacterium]|nr:hypothetical protein [Actinomycetota bacterium]